MTIMYVIMQFATDQQRPTPKQLSNVTRFVGVATKWYNLGLQLLDESSILDRIKSNNQSDVDHCCNEMFKEWLQTKPDANWNQLVIALIEIDLKTAASYVTKSFTKPNAGNYKVAICDWILENRFKLHM